MFCKACQQEIGRTYKKHYQEAHGLTLEQYYLQYESKTGQPPQCQRAGCTRPATFSERLNAYNAFCGHACSRQFINNAAPTQHVGSRPRPAYQVSRDGLRRTPKTKPC